MIDYLTQNGVMDPQIPSLGAGVHPRFLRFQRSNAKLCALDLKRPIMNATDIQFAKALKLVIKLSGKQNPSQSDRQKAVSAFKKAKIALPPLCRPSAQSFFDYFLRHTQMQELGTPEAPPWLSIQNLVESGLEVSSLTAFKELRKAARQLGTDDIIRLAPSPEAIDEWLNSCPDEAKAGVSDREYELIQKSASVPPGLLSKPCLFWLVGTLAVKRLPFGVMTVASIEDPELVRRCLALAIQKDFTRQFPILWLEQTGAPGLDVLREVIVAQSEVEEAFVRGIPVAVSRGGLNEAWFELLRSWFREMPSAPAAQESAMALRLETVAALLRYCAPSVDRAKALGIARETAKILRQQISSPRQLERFWVPCVLEDVPAVGEMR